ncbi:MAG: dimethyl sulfoxide reductase anchor subunit, partial [Proteobacteria bacterium]|nr:dimethyl sulfoxide reductase anchor subunit [Pseudomonadota bacterium]
MRPEISLVLLTTLSGVGQGLFIFVTILFISTHFGTLVPMELVVGLSVISLLFPGLGGIASFFHLGQPGRGWKAIRKWKYSWLSREVILLPVFTGLVSLFLLGLLLEFSYFQLTVIALLACTASLGLYLASAMLYAAIHFIREWSNLFTVFNFILFGITSGFAFGASALLLFVPDGGLGQIAIVALVVLGGISLILKLMTYWYNDHFYNPWGLKNALGINAPQIRLMDTGASYETYNSHEFHLPM